MVELYVWEFASVLVLLFLSALFSCSETAITCVNRLRVRRLAREGHEGAKALLAILSRPEQPLSAILLGNDIVNVSISVILAYVLTSAMGVQGIPVAMAVATLTILVFGEITPKSIAINNSERIALAVARPLSLWTSFLSPIAHRILPLATRVNTLIRERGGDVEGAVTKEEIRMLIETGESEGAVESGERRMLDSVLELNEVRVKEVMVPRRDVVCIDVGASFGEALSTVVKSGYSRIPVFEGTRDSIIGIVHVKDILKSSGRPPGEVDLRSILRPVPLVPETKRAGELLRELQSGNQHLAVVINEYGSTAGVVTIEDLIERIVGDIRDEFDRDEEDVVVLEGGHVVVDGSLSIHDVNSRFKLSLPVDEAKTIAGFVYTLFNRIPRVGETTAWQGAGGKVVFHVLSMERHRVSKLRIETGQGAGEGAGGSARDKGTALAPAPAATDAYEGVERHAHRNGAASDEAPVRVIVLGDEPEKSGATPAPGSPPSEGHVGKRGGHRKGAAP